MVALERVGIKVDKYYASEIDPYAIKISKKNYPDIIRLGDVTKWRNWDIDWKRIDLLIGGSPCQSLSITQSKTRKHLDGKSKLFFEYVDILNQIKKYNPSVKFLFENVASMSKESKIEIESCLGVELVYQNSNAFLRKTDQEFTEQIFIFCLSKPSQKMFLETSCKLMYRKNIFTTANLIIMEISRFAPRCT